MKVTKSGSTVDRLSGKPKCFQERIECRQRCQGPKFWTTASPHSRTVSPCDLSVRRETAVIVAPTASNNSLLLFFIHCARWSASASTSAADAVSDRGTDGVFGSPPLPHSCETVGKRAGKREKEDRRADMGGEAVLAVRV